MNTTVIFSSLCSSIWYIIWHTSHFKRDRNQWISRTSIINTTAGAQFVFRSPRAQSYISTDVVPNQRGPVVHILGAQLAKGPSQADPHLLMDLNLIRAVQSYIPVVFVYQKRPKSGPSHKIEFILPKLTLDLDSFWPYAGGWTSCTGAFMLYTPMFADRCTSIWFGWDKAK